MGMLDLFKKKQTAALSRHNQPSIEQITNHVLRVTESQIREGLSKPTASTGTPIDELRGAAKSIAQMSNIGGGSKATGGGGIEKGMDTLVKHHQAKSLYALFRNQKKLGK